MSKDLQDELEKEAAELRAQLRDQQLRIRELDEQLRLKEETLRWIYSSRIYRLSRGLCKALDRVLLPLRGRRPQAQLPDRLRAAARGSNGELEQRPSDVPFERSLPPAQRLDIVRLPIIDWTFRFQRPQQLMREMAREGHRIFYVRNRFQDLSPEIQLESLEERVHGVTLPGPTDLSVYTDRIGNELLGIFVRAFDEMRLCEGIHQAAVIVDLPFWEPLAQELRRRFGWKLVYDCMDEHAGFSTNTDEMLEHEDSLLRSSDLVITTARVLTEKAKEANDSVLVLPNAGEFEHFARAERHEFFDTLSGPVVGYYGAISDWFDDAMIVDAARARPGWNFVLIGSTDAHDVSALEALPNVHLLGEKPYRELPRWLHGFDVACIPFKDNELTRATNPVKFFEYLSSGKPVVSVPLYELEPYEGQFYPAKDGESFVSAVEQALADSSPSEGLESRIECRREIGRQNTWQARGQRLHRALGQLFGKAAILVISYHNLEILQQCLESIWAHTLHPDYEVIVVDNASGEDVTSYLRNEAEREPRLRVQFNSDNRGFAGANNQAIEMAQDADYLILLNNDTIVPEGWLSRLLRYLRNPTIGLVGPVTSWAGNEAKIDVPYKDPSGIAEFAYQYTAKHADEHFDIRVLAMFCVAMRRELIDEIGPLDERYGIGMFEDDDFSMRVRAAGYRTICAEDCFVHHWGEKSFKKLERPEYYAIFEANKAKFEEKWGEEWTPHSYRSWNADEQRPTHYDRFSNDCWIWTCPLCKTPHRSSLAQDQDALLCSNCGSDAKRRAVKLTEQRTSFFRYGISKLEINERLRASQ
jgi:GT2 family glycosyltransferase/glycosyltransferase involved in cell wall biosynthesis